MSSSVKPRYFRGEGAVLKYVDKLAQENEFAKGWAYAGDKAYKFLIEGWEDFCLEEVVKKEKGDWEDAEYLYGLVNDLHEEIVRTDFISKYPGAKVIRSDVIDGAQWGVSVIVARIKKKSRRAAHARAMI